MASNRREFLAGIGALTMASARGDDAHRFVTVKAPAGSLRGRAVGDVCVFTGIPFGATTAGNARFRPPRPAAKWSGTFDATRPARIPPQPTNFLFPKLPGVPSEDCLQLNVWTPKRPGRYPVLVWMYGGENLQGSCAEPLYDCTPFARQGIVAVNFNYRLGALGFLELGGILGPEYRGSANNAMRDQLLALHWVKHNISAFGGDPDQVTMAGQSAGGGNLIALLGAPARKGLIRRAIVASGTRGVQDIAISDAFARVFIEQLGNPARLHSASVEEILIAQGKALAKWPYGPPFWAMIDGKGMPAIPNRAVATGSARDVELMIGWCRDETRDLFPEAVVNDPRFMEKSTQEESAKMERIVAAYTKEYPKLTQAELNWRMSTAEIFVMPSLRIANAQASAGGSVYTYRFDYAVRNGPFGTDTPHGLDVPMVFDQIDSPVAKFFGLSGSDLPMGNTVHALWSSFIRKGTFEAGIPFWPPYDLRAKQTMILDRTSHVVENVNRFDREVWK